jgi:hypothetical protein
VFPEVLAVTNLPADVLRCGGHRPGTGQFPIREHIPVDETAADPGDVPVVRPGDAVVEEPSARTGLPVQEIEVVRVVGHPDVFGETDRAIASKSSSGTSRCPVPTSARSTDLRSSLPGPGGLLSGEG